MENSLQEESNIINRTELYLHPLIKKKLDEKQKEINNLKRTVRRLRQSKSKMKVCVQKLKKKNKKSTTNLN